MASILVTGASGFIGSALCRALRDQQHNVMTLSSAKGDIADPATLAPLAPVQHVFHLAALTFVPDSWERPLEFHRVNVLGTANVLEYCRRHRARLTFVSAYLYGEAERLPVSEASALRPNNPYALSKYLAEQICAFYAAHHDVGVTVLRPFNVFGPGQKPHFLIPQVLAHLREGRSIRVKDLAPRRDYVYLADLVDALVRTLGESDSYNVFNIGSGRSVSVQELIDLIQAVAGTSLPVVCEGTARRNELHDVRADIEKARLRLGWAPRHTIEEGVRIMIREAA
jgi:GDP-4-dehydro-6-deoxy-D-mannose reductase